MEISALIRRRSAVKGRVTKTSNSVRDKIQKHEMNVKEAQELYDKVKNLEKELTEVQNEIVSVCDDEKFEEEEEYFDQVSTTIHNIKVELKDYMQPASDKGETNSSFRSNIQLPAIKLPIFNGTVENWASFKDMFMELVHNNADLQPIQKFQYLKSCLIDDAAVLIQHLPLTSANYYNAWSMLIDTYLNKYAIVSYHLKNIFNVNYSSTDRMTTLKSMLLTVRSNLNALKSIGLNTDSWDIIIIYLLEQKLDSNLYQDWVKKIDQKTLPRLEQFYEFLSEMILIAERTEGSKENHTREVSVSTMSNTCACCKQKHRLYECDMFKKLNIKDRISLVNKNNICFNCLSTDRHSAYNCSSKSVCKNCARKHHSLLHSQFSPQANCACSSNTLESNHTSKLDTEDNADECIENEECLENKVTSVCSQVGDIIQEQILLSTVLVKIRNVSTGQYNYARALLDSGSQSCFISLDCVKRLNLVKKNLQEMTVNGIGGSNAFKVTSYCEFVVESRINDYTLPIKALVVPKVTNKLPAVSLNNLNWEYTSQFSLADPDFNSSHDIDIIIGAEHFYSLLCSGTCSAPIGYPNLQNSQFGWIVSGKVGNSTNCNVSCLHVNLDGDLKRFWELEEIPSEKFLSKEEALCEDHFVKNVQRGSDGRYIVKLPFQDNVLQLGESKPAAIARLRTVQKHLNKCEGKREDYYKFMREYEELGHMTKVSKCISNESLPYYYLPHHAIVRESSSTTRLRVVFDGSAKTTTGLSLNSCLRVGPTLQQNIFNLLVRLRKYPILLKADCEKMYRQIWIHPDDRKFQKIIWYNNCEKDNVSLAEYELNTLTYGTSCAPFIAVRCLLQLAKDERKNYPNAAKITERDFFMDDLVTGANTETEALQTYNDLTKMFLSAGFNLRKWTCNNINVLNHIPEINRDPKVNMDFIEDGSHTVRTLGLCCDMKTDTLFYDVSPSDINLKLTKRSILSDISRYYDPLGLLSPVIILAKIRIQKLWLANLGWDDEILGEFAASWHSYTANLTYLKEINISRNVIPFQNSVCIELHGFADASEVAYAAAIYVRVVANNEVASNLLCAKSRVAPLRQISLPRLELCAALLLAKLMSEVQRELEIPVERCFAWTDSTIVLHWLRQEPRNWKTFVANRVSQIQELLGANVWYHVCSEDNPADLASRGIQGDMLKSNRKWWYGPNWLVKPDIIYEKEKGKEQQFTNFLGDPLEKKKLKSTALVSNNENMEPITIWNRTSSFVFMINTMAWCLRFKNNLIAKVRKIPISRNRSLVLEADEIRDSTLELVKLVQRQAFNKDINKLMIQKELKSKSNLKNLCPFLDQYGILKVGGRLRNTELTFEAKHPTLLPRSHKFTQLLVEHYHKKNAHAGPTLLLAIIRQQYWIVQGLSITKKVFHECMSCFRANPMRNQHKQKMGDLPMNRVRINPPFAICGVDYAGPFSVRRIGGRSNIIFKVYLALFVCFSTKAYHIELVTDLSTMAFIATLRRFVGRRGLPSNIYSDNGTNFVGTDNKLKRFLNELYQDNDFRVLHNNEKIMWHFIPANSPHMGGLWECGVKSVKTHLRRVVGDQILTFEELNNVCISVEAVLNSRPLTPLSNDANDLEVLTPGHFLIGRPLTAIPEPDVSNSVSNRLSRWNLTQKIYQDFWKRWSLEYLNTLNQRNKWQGSEPNVKINDMVLIKDDNLPPTKWKLGRVVNVFPGDDNLVRVVSIKTSSGVLKRSTSRIVGLPMDA